MSSSEKVICKNCGTEYVGLHCPHCGQSADIGRFTVKGMLKELYFTFSDADSTFCNTVRSLFCRPGHMVREYLIGERQKYYKPIKMLMFLVAVYIILMSFITTEESQEDILIRDKFSELTILGGALPYFINFFQNKVYASLLQALLFTIPFTWVFGNCKITFKEKNESGEPVESALNLAEHFYTIVYISCLLVIIGYIEIPLRLFFGYEFGFTEGILLNLILCVICYKQLLGISWVKSLWKVILGMILMVAILFSIMLVIVFIASILLH